MRSVALDLGKKIYCCEVKNGKVVERRTVRELKELLNFLGPTTPPARVAIEACREAWFVEAELRRWGKEPILVDTTRSEQLGIGQHGRKTDRIDAEVLARAVEKGIVPEAHLLSPHRQQLRYQLGVRRTLVETRAQYITPSRFPAIGHRLSAVIRHRNKEGCRILMAGQHPLRLDPPARLNTPAACPPCGSGCGHE